MRPHYGRQTLIAALAAAAIGLSCACGRGDDRRAGGGPAEVQVASSASAAPSQTPGPLADFQGRIIFQSDLEGDNEIYGMTAEGVRKLTDNTWSDEYPRFSPDGTRIAFKAAPAGHYDIFVMAADGSGLAAVADSADDEADPAWSADGRTLYYDRGRPGSRDTALWAIDLGTRIERPVISGFSRSHGLADVSPAAPLLTFTGHRLMGWDVFLFDAEKGSYRELTRGGKSCRARFSPDGARIAYVSSRADGKGDVWLMAPDGSGDERLTLRDETSDYFPSWSPDGDTIVFCSSREHDPRRGVWSLFIVKVASKTVAPLFRSGARDLFPDWR